MKGYALVEYETYKEALAAKEELDGEELFLFRISRCVFIIRFEFKMKFYNKKISDPHPHSHVYSGNDILGQTIAVEWAFVKGPRKQRKSRH